MKDNQINVVGAGLAGCEAAWQIANFGIKVNLYEMRPGITTPAHHTKDFGELVCSNSFGAINPERAAGLLQEELRLFKSIILQIADKYSVPAGGALAVDRSKFSSSLTKILTEHPLINVSREEFSEIPETAITILATGPLTSEKLASKIRDFTGIDSCHFYDAASPIVFGDSINKEVIFKASRYDKGDAAYFNCPMNEEEYNHFRNELISAEQAEVKDFDKETANFFEACLPIEEIARRGQETMRYGPLKSIGLWNPEWGDLHDIENRRKKRPHAIVQLRKEDTNGKLLNMVGFQTNLKWSEQKRIFRMIPGLEQAEFARFGVMHRNTFLESPKLLLPTLQFSKRDTLFASGQLTGTEGYLAATAGGMLAGINAALLVKGKKPITFPEETMIGALMNFISNRNKVLANQKKNKFQPMPASFGLIPELPMRVKDKKLRYKAYKERALLQLKQFKEILNSQMSQEKTLIGTVS